jgi:predicted nuclease of restriction endonuclease-like (RecB) superfamily
MVLMHTNRKLVLKKGMHTTAKLYQRIRQILESAHVGVARTVNTTQVYANWLIGREIVVEEQRGKRRAGYGERIIQDLSVRLQADFGKGFAVRNLETFRQFYLEYPNLVKITHALRAQSEVRHALRGKSDLLRRTSTENTLAIVSPFSHAVSAESWQTGQLHPNLSWTHYRTLLRVGQPDARAFYEIEAIHNNWSARELERQINSLLFERLAKSKDKAGLMKLATKGHEVQQATDVFKDPVVIEFLGLPESSRLVESELEDALINHLQAFLLEMGTGFAFVSRQERLTIEGDHFYIDLVFYHTILKCYLLIDLKIGKLTHQDLGQLQLYVNYFDQERRTAGDNPTLGLILCTDKNDAVVRYTLGPDQQQKIFASRYKLHLPTEAELKTELQRELKLIERTAEG